MKKNNSKYIPIVIFVVIIMAGIIYALCVEDRDNDRKGIWEYYSVPELSNNCSYKKYILNNNKVLLEITNNNSVAVDLNYLIEYKNGKYEIGSAKIAPYSIAYSYIYFENYKDDNKIYLYAD